MKFVFPKRSRNISSTSGFRRKPDGAGCRPTTISTALTVLCACSRTTCAKVSIARISCRNAPSYCRAAHGVLLDERQSHPHFAGAASVDGQHRASQEHLSRANFVFPRGPLKPRHFMMGKLDPIESSSICAASLRRSDPSTGVQGRGHAAGRPATAGSRLPCPAYRSGLDRCLQRKAGQGNPSLDPVFSGCAQHGILRDQRRCLAKQRRTDY